MNERQCKTIPIKEVERAIALMQYGSTERVMFLMLALTGCRTSELNNMKRSLLRKDCLYFKLGKNQPGYRKMDLPEVYLAELKHYWEHHRVPADSFFSCTAASFRRRFDRFTRPFLGPAWLQKEPYLAKNGFCEDYKYQLKALRKNFQTLLWHQLYEKYGDALVASEMVASEMNHSSFRITLHHYVRARDSLLEDGCVLPKQGPCVLDLASQVSLVKYC